jgi:hypothetical protein
MKVETLLQSSHRAPAGLLIASALADDMFKLSCEQGADGSIFLGGENAGFAQQFCFDFECDVGFHLRTPMRAALFTCEAEEWQ